MLPIGPFVLCSIGGLATPDLLSAAVLRRLGAGWMSTVALKPVFDSDCHGQPNPASGCKTLGSYMRQAPSREWRALAFVVKRGGENLLRRYDRSGQSRPEQ